MTERKVGLEIEGDRVYYREFRNIGVGGRFVGKRESPSQMIGREKAAGRPVVKRRRPLGSGRTTPAKAGNVRAAELLTRWLETPDDLGGKFWREFERDLKRHPFCIG